ncbi:O-antigen ligase family protein [Tichowtungia aerotolerans]|uniref:O-antigen ligase-related domain-containing protein n=1 Tax=Tichowtungia aerotolerans TaxID=2697043 RepID=A0A6P1M642_9BACT|nr:O-antigen ligase family protein [Tichowtungia aerotolerans]QHI70279.1 hypothetical protein GT409_12785 [Tichowtungia aerotolerans]
MPSFKTVMLKNASFAGMIDEVPSFIFPVAAGIAVGLFAVSVPLMVSAIMFAGMVALLVTVARPDWALCLYFCGVAFMTDDTPKPGADYFIIPDADIIEGLPSALVTFFLLMFCVTTARLMILEQRRPPVSLIPLAVFGFFLVVALLTGFYRGGDPELYRVDFTGMLFPVLGFYLCQTLLNSRERIMRMLYLLLGVAAVKALILTAYYLAGRGWIYQLDSNAAYRITTMDSADLLLFITLLLMVAHLIVRGDIKGFQAIAAGAACLPLLYIVVFSYRRAQWVGLVFSAGLLFLGASRKTRNKMAMLILAVLLLGIAGAVTAGLDADKAARIGSRIGSIFDTKQSSNVYHVLESRQVLIDLSGSPVLGLGLGSKHSPLGLYEVDEVPANVVHNAFLYIWMKIGLPGLLFFFWAAAVFGRRILRFRKMYIESDQWGLVLPVAASTGLWLATFLTGPVPWYLHQTGLIALFASIAVTLMRQAEDVSIQTGGDSDESSDCE